MHPDLVRTPSNPACMFFYRIEFKVHLALALGASHNLRGLNAWVQYFYHVFWPDPCLLLDMKTQVKVQRIGQFHIS